MCFFLEQGHGHRCRRAKTELHVWRWDCPRQPLVSAPARVPRSTAAAAQHQSMRSRARCCEGPISEALLQRLQFGVAKFLLLEACRCIASPQSSCTAPMDVIASLVLPNSFFGKCAGVPHPGRAAACDGSASAGHRQATEQLYNTNRCDRELGVELLVPVLQPRWVCRCIASLSLIHI